MGLRLKMSVVLLHLVLPSSSLIWRTVNLQYNSKGGKTKAGKQLPFSSSLQSTLSI